MKILKLIKKNKSLRNISIIIFIGWLFLVGFSTFLFFDGINDTRNYEINEITNHYTNVFDEYNEKIILMTAYFTDNSVVLTDSEFHNFVESVVDGNDTITSVSIAPAGVIEHVYPSSLTDEIGYDIMSHVTPYENNVLLESIQTHNITYSYRVVEERVSEILIRKPVFIDDDFYGFLTMTIDNSGFATEQFTYSSRYLNVALFNEDDVLIYGLGEIQDYTVHQLVVDEVTLKIAENNKTNFLVFRGSNIIGFVLSATLVYYLILIILTRHTKVYQEVSEELNYRKNFDAETNLYNIDRLYVDVKYLTETKKIFYLGFLNINNVKYINEKFGHMSTSNLLKKTTSMISRVLRNNSTLYRYGGDEYVLVIESDSSSEVKNLLRRIVKIFESDIVSGSIRTRLGISIGVTQFPINGHSVEELIKNAHLAAASINNYDKEAFKFYRPDQNRNKMLNEDFDKMVSNLNLDFFEVFLMPIVDVQTNQISGFECLTRAFDDLGEVLPTEDVILSLERNGRIQELDEAVFRKMLSIMKRLNKEIPEEDYFLSLNASALSLNDEYVKNIINLYKHSKISKGQIVLELTESYQVEDYDYLITLFKELNENGIKIAIDDFGSGYSSISYIAKFPIYAIKVDKEYVRDYRDNEFNKTLLMTLKSIAEVLKCKLVAEGVDSPDTLEFLKEFGCPYYQGYLFSKGIPFEDAVALIKNNLPKNNS